MKNQYRVMYWTQDVTEYKEVSEPIHEGSTEIVLVKKPSNGTTTFNIQLSQVDMNEVNQMVGTTYVTLNRLTEYDAQAKAEIEQQLAKMDLFEESNPDPLEQAKQLRWGRLIAIRDGLESKGFNYLGKTFDSDQRSILRILSAVQAATSAALTGRDFEVGWTTADNSVITMTRDQILALPAALAQSVNEIHMQARELRLALDNAGSIEEVYNVKWPGVEYEVVEPYNPFDENGDLPSVA